MIESRYFWIHSKEQLDQVAKVIMRLEVGPGEIAEVIIQPMRKEKTDAQRRLWHAVLRDFSKALGLTPYQTKMRVKEEYYGLEKKRVRWRERDKKGRWRSKWMTIEYVPSSEDEDREGYGRLIDFTYQLAAEQGYHIPDRRPPK